MSKAEERAAAKEKRAEQQRLQRNRRKRQAYEQNKKDIAAGIKQPKQRWKTTVDEYGSRVQVPVKTRAEVEKEKSFIPMRENLKNAGLLPLTPKNSNVPIDYIETAANNMLFGKIPNVEPLKIDDSNIENSMTKDRNRVINTQVLNHLANVTDAANEQGLVPETHWAAKMNRQQFTKHVRGMYPKQTFEPEEIFPSEFNF